MKHRIKQLALNPLILSSFLLFSGGIVANIFNFLFNLLMSRNLSVVDYGTLGSLISIITLLAVPAGAILPTVITSAGKYFADQDIDLINALYLKLSKALGGIGLVIILVFVVFLGPISDFFNIHDRILLILTAVAVVISYFMTLNFAFATAKLSFRFLSVSNAIASLTKVCVGMGLVLLGMGLFGAVIGYIFAFVVPVIISTIFLSKIIFHKSKNAVSVSYKQLISYGVPSAIVVFCLNAFIATDLLLVKSFFSQEEAGLYAGLSLIGRVVFYVTAPIATVMFPTVVNRFEKGEDYRSVFFGALAIVGGLASVLTLFYYVFPQFTILFFLKRPEYLAISSELALFGVFTTLYSLVSILSYYFLSIKQMKVAGILAVGALLQATVIYVLHDSFSQIILTSIVIMVLLLIFLIWLYQKSKPKILVA